MNKAVLGVAGVLIAVGAVVAVVAMGGKDEEPSSNQPTTASDSSPSQSTPAQEEQNSSQQGETSKEAVEIKDFAFSPATLKVKKGTTVVWNNQDTIAHNVQPDSESDDFMAGPMLAKGQEYSFTFNKIGTYTYHCLPHPQMKGTIEVVE